MVGGGGEGAADEAKAALLSVPLTCGLETHRHQSSGWTGGMVDALAAAAGGADVVVAAGVLGRSLGTG